jgi:uncharacterized protein (DUF1499 family)
MYAAAKPDRRIWNSAMARGLTLGLALALTLGTTLLAQAAEPRTGLGVRDGRLQPPSSTPNSVSSQAGLYPDHPQRSYAEIEPLRFKGSGEEAMRQATELVRTTPGATLITQTPGYLHAEMRTRWLKFTDDLELLLDERASLIHVRSASRLGLSDFGANRDRVQVLRVRFEALQTGQTRP